MKKKLLPIHPIAITFLGLGLLGGLLHFLSTLSPDIADFINLTIGHAIRFVLSKTFGIFPCSFAEFLLFSSPLILFFTVYFAVKVAKKGKIHVIRALSGVLAIGAAVYFCFGASFGPCYRTSTLYEKLSLEKREISAADLYVTTYLMVTKLNEVCEEIDYSADGSSVCPLSIRELSSEISDCYKRLYDENKAIPTFSSKVKPLIISPAMTYTHISGIYSFFTGEANINTNYPDYVIVYTAAHEMAHQRGIAREDEANFVAFLVLADSENPYLRYSAYLNMYDYLASALYSADAELYFKAADKLSPKVNGELIAFSNLFEKYKDSTASTITDSLNDAYLVNQSTEGTKSYGMVVDLAVAYYFNGNSQNEE